MRWLVVLLLLAPAIAAAKPSIAVAPFDGDDDNKVAIAVAKALEDDASSVIGPKETGKAMDKLGLSGRLDTKDQKKLRKKLDVDVVIQGKVEDKTVELRIAGKGIEASKVDLEFKNTGLKFRREVREAVAPKLGEGKGDDDDEPKEVAETDDGEETKVRKKKKKKRNRDDDDDAREDAPVGRHAVTQAAIRGNVGAGFARRGLTYDATGNQQPPPVGTAGPSGRIEVEAYPASMSTLKGFVAGLGLYGVYDRTFLVSIDVPRSNASSTVTQQHFAIGARYRLAFGSSTVAFGVGYANRKYAADRSGLGNAMLDMPDVNYSGITPNVVARFGVTPKIGLFFSGGVMLLLAAGDITTTYGYANTLGFDVAAGADIALAPRYGLRAAFEFNQVGLSFDTPMRGVSAATDRTIGLVASFEVLY